MLERDSRALGVWHSVVGRCVEKNASGELPPLALDWLALALAAVPQVLTSEAWPEVRWLRECRVGWCQPKRLCRAEGGLGWLLWFAGAFRPERPLAEIASSS